MTVRKFEHHEPATARPRIVLTRARAAIIVVFGYAVIFVVVARLLAHVDAVRSHQDARLGQVTTMFAVFTAVLCIGSLYFILRRPKPDPADPA